MTELKISGGTEGPGTGDRGAQLNCSDKAWGERATERETLFNCEKSLSRAKSQRGLNIENRLEYH